MASNRCPSCNRFVSVELGDAEVEVDTLDEGDGKAGTLSLTIKLSKVCSDCGTELSTKEIDAEVSVDLTEFEDAT